MTDRAEQRVQAPAGPRSVRFVELSGEAMTALLDDDLDRAGAEVGVTLPEYFVTDEAKWVWQYRIGQLTSGPGSAGWLTRAVVAEPEGHVVGYAGFHGPPDEAGMVEIGYSVAPGHRRQGYARSMLAGLVRRAVADDRVRTVRVTISPDNAASLATIAGFGFTEVGEQWDERDGLEIIFETPAEDPPAPVRDRA
ncbi:GNAT family N-acetyltransferase [Streptomyces sp. HU2014]|uniref:GNAT family N-acetyltransferase n=1 Tax=Streptomyces sp. HU2014 TaxID=2939414 RepID=UPI00200C33F4|nr:GNAT family N-acetyltransferase [Streptomyces sp. HU2014]UQI46298.1 GNAT family N-acetyltransferase [Streptomyces sp. HU2014]